MQYTHVEHGFAPIYNSESKILILGSMPSVQSRKNGFYYGNRQNRFWRVLAALLSCPVPDTVEEKTAMLLEHRIALWDVISSCDIAGSSDASIKNVIPADLQSVLNESDISAIYANGKTAEKIYRKYQQPATGRDIVLLPSTSAANASWSLQRLISRWRELISTDFPCFPLF